MTGTASEIHETACNAKQQLNNFNLLSSWLFGRISTGCTLVEITHRGCSILIPRKYRLISDHLSLVIMSPDDKHQAIMVLTVEKRWLNSDYSDSLVKAGFMFTHVEQKDRLNIERMTEHFKRRNVAPIHCNLVNM